MGQKPEQQESGGEEELSGGGGEGFLCLSCVGEDACLLCVLKWVISNVMVEYGWRERISIPIFCSFATS